MLPHITCCKQERAAIFQTSFKSLPESEVGASVSSSLSVCKYQGWSLWAGVEMKSINKGLAGVIPDFIRQCEMG